MTKPKGTAKLSAALKKTAHAKTAAIKADKAKLAKILKKANGQSN